MKKKMSFLFIIFILIIILSTIAILRGETITGKISVQPTNISIQVLPTLPTLSIINPKNGTYLINNLLLNYSTTNANTIWYNLDNTINTTITSPTYFNAAQGSHILYLYVNNSDGITAKNVSFAVNLTKLKIHYNKFKGSSTDFNQYSLEEMQNLSGIVLENTGLGKIIFNEIIDLTNDENPNDAIVNLSAHINISENKIEINSTALPNFNKSATLFLYNLAFSNPRILKDGSVCPSDICIQNSYMGGTLSFNVTKFTVYSIEEMPLEISSGGGGRKSGIDFINLDKEKIKVTLEQGSAKEEKITIKNTGNYRLRITLGYPDINDFLRINETDFYLNAGESKIINLNFFSAEKVLPDLYVGKIIISTGGRKKEILVGVEVESQTPLFDVKTEIPKQSLNIMPGEEIFITIILYNIKNVGLVDVNLDYTIKDGEGNTITKEQETLAVETQISFIKNFKIPENIKQGNYMFYVKANYDGKVGSASNWFTITKPLSINKIIIPAFLGVIITLILFIIYQIRKTKKRIKHSKSK